LVEGHGSCGHLEVLRQEHALSNHVVRPSVALVAVMGSLAFTASAGAATLSVDDDGADCPAASYTSIQAAVDAAAPGDTVTVCAGDYAEGTGQVGTNALTITKSLTLKGAGADLVSISPKASSPASGRIMETTPDLRNGIGDIVAVVGGPTRPITVDISGVTVDGFTPERKPVAVEAGIVYLDGKGSITRSRVTNTVTSEGASAFDLPGGYRGPQPGVGIVQTSAARTAPGDGTRTLAIELTRVDRYNRYGILIDGAANDIPPLTPSGTINRGLISASQVVGRTQCVDYAATGNCSAAVVGPVTTGPLFGQDGIRVTAGARAQIADSQISQNLVNGTGAPTRETLGATPTPGTNNQNLPLGAGIRLVGAYMTTNPVSQGLPRSYNTSVTRSNIVDNGYGAVNLAADGVTPNTGTKNDTYGVSSNVFLAENNWWGLRIATPSDPNANPGPLISPTNNPIWPENPVNGTAIADGAGTTSSAVDVFPYRNGVQSDPDSGQFAVADAAMPIDDAAPTGVTIAAGASTVAPGGTVQLTATATDDFGIKRVRFSDGATVVGDVTKPAYAQSVVIPATAECGSTRSYTALATDSLGQSTRSAAAVVTVACAPTPPTTPAPPTVPAPAAPTVAFSAKPVTIKGSATVRLAVNAPAGVRRVDVRLGDRLVCSDVKAPYACTVKATGADVGAQALTATLVDQNGSSAVASTKVTVAKFAAKVRLAVTTKAVKGGKARRTVRGTLALPAGVTKAQGCRGTVTVTIKRSGRALLDQQVKVSKACTFTRSVVASRATQRFTVSARFGGTAVLKTASSSRRFS
jgi:hypothetical protein